MSHSLYLQKRTELLRRAEVQSRARVVQTLAEIAKLDAEFKRSRK